MIIYQYNLIIDHDYEFDPVDRIIDVPYSVIGKRLYNPLYLNLHIGNWCDKVFIRQMCKNKIVFDHHFTCQLSFSTSLPVSKVIRYLKKHGLVNKYEL